MNTKNIPKFCLFHHWYETHWTQEKILNIFHSIFDLLSAFFWRRWNIFPFEFQLNFLSFVLERRRKSINHCWGYFLTSCILKMYKMPPFSTHQRERQNKHEIVPFAAKRFKTPSQSPLPKSLHETRRYDAKRWEEKSLCSYRWVSSNAKRNKNKNLSLRRKSSRFTVRFSFSSKWN